LISSSSHDCRRHQAFPSSRSPSFRWPPSSSLPSGVVNGGVCSSRLLPHFSILTVPNLRRRGKGGILPYPYWVTQRKKICMCVSLYKYTYNMYCCIICIPVPSECSKVSLDLSFYCNFQI
jgi:hypothetical protein